MGRLYVPRGIIPAGRSLRLYIISPPRGIFIRVGGTSADVPTHMCTAHPRGCT